MPMRSLATATFEAAVRPLLGAFDSVVYGVGRGSLTSTQKALDRVPRPVHRFPSNPSVIVRWSWGHRELYFGADFADAGLRDAAAERVGSMGGELWGEPLRATVVEARPGAPVRGERFMAACQAVAGASNNWHTISAPDLPIDLVPSVMEIEDTRSSMREFIRGHTTFSEQLATEFDLVRSFAVREDERDALIVEIEGAGAGVRELGAVDIGVFSDPLFSVRLAREIGLPAGTSVRRMRKTSRGWRKDPTVEVAMEYQKLSAEFNRGQTPYYLNVLDEDEVRLRLNEGLAAALRDAQDLFEANIPVVGVRTEPKVLRTYAVLLPGRRRGDVPSFIVAYFKLETDEPGLEYAVRQDFDLDSGSPEEALRSTYGSLMPADWYGGWSVESSFFAGALGYDDRSLRTWRIEDLLHEAEMNAQDTHHSE